MRKKYRPLIGDIISCDLSNGKISIFRKGKSVAILMYQGEINRENITNTVVSLVSPFGIKKVKELKHFVQYKIIPLNPTSRKPVMAFFGAETQA